MGFWKTLKKMQSPVKGDKASDILLVRPQAWHDQRQVNDPQPVEQPVSIDYTDLSMLGWKP
jgi:hypothetical protein